MVLRRCLIGLFFVHASIFAADESSKIDHSADSSYSPEVLKIKVDLQKYYQLDWQRKADALNLITVSNYGNQDEKIIQAALEEDNKLLVVQAMKKIYELDLKSFSEILPPFLENGDVMVRYHALVALEKISQSEDILSKIMKLSRDKEWMIREAAFRAVRKYQVERSEKKYFYDVLFRVNEKNPQVVIEIFRTLVWYDDETAWPYLLKRSYHCQSAAELIEVMRELAKIKTRDVQVRLKTLTRSQSMIVRKEAIELLREYY